MGGASLTLPMLRRLQVGLLSRYFWFDWQSTLYDMGDSCVSEGRLVGAEVVYAKGQGIVLQRRSSFPPSLRCILLSHIMDSTVSVLCLCSAATSIACLVRAIASCEEGKSSHVSTDAPRLTRNPRHESCTTATTDLA